MTEARIVLVTGAFGALGTAVARKFHAQGARLVLINHAAVPTWATKEYPFPHVLIGGVDLSDRDVGDPARPVQGDDLEPLVVGVGCRPVEVHRLRFGDDD